MQPIKDIEKVKKMFAQGYPYIKDGLSGYIYTMTAHCPKDGNFASVSRIEKLGQVLTRLTFQCNVCSTEFEVSEDDIFVY